MRWIIVLILFVLGWVTLLTVQITDLYGRYTELKELNEQQKIMIKEYKAEAEHNLLVYEQLCDGISRGIREEW